MNSEFFLLLPAIRRGEPLEWSAIVNALGFQPSLPALRKFLDAHNYYLCAGQCFKRAGDLIAKSGRPASPDELHGGNRKL
jgi:hypothetical protein